MISVEDQNDLLLLIADYIKKDIECVAFGGTAMMYKQYKVTTKDIDLVFFYEEDVKEFIKAIEKLGYKKNNNLKDIYPQEKKDSTPLMFTRGDERFDLFLKKVFQTKINEEIKNRSGEIRDFNGNKLLRLRIISDEDLILLKAITSRDRDFEDIVMICKKNPNIKWDIIISEAISQAKKGDKFIILDLEETMNKLKQHCLIKKKFFDRLYNFNI